MGKLVFHGYPTEAKILYVRESGKGKSIFENFKNCSLSMGRRSKNSPLVAAGCVLENLLNVDVHLPQDRRRDRVAVALVGENGHSPLYANRPED